MLSSDEDVSDVDPDELQRMLEGMDFSEELGKTPAKAQRPSASEKANPTLKSSIKTSGNGVEQQRKVQFSKDTKGQKDASGKTTGEDPFAIADLLGSSDEESPGTSKLSNAASSQKTSSTTAANEAAASSTSGGQTNKSKLKDLFGLEENNKNNNQFSPNSSMNNTRRTGARKPKIEDEDDDLLAGLGDSSSAPKPVAAKPSNDFMSSLFGGSSINKNTEQKKEFVLDERYIKSTIAEPAKPAAQPASAPPAGRSRRGTPYVTPTVGSSGEPTLPNPAPKSVNPPSSTQSIFNAPPQPAQDQRPTVTSQSSLLAAPTVVNNELMSENQNILKKQVQQMDEFERDQQAKFLREIEDHKNQLEAQQADHRSVLNHQRTMAQEQMKVYQERQASSLRHQQAQCEMLMKQVQSQMETEMRMKTELVRNQMKILAEVQPVQGGGETADLSDIINQLSSPNNNANFSTINNERLEQMYKKREERLNSSHEEEMEDLQKRIRHWVQRCQEQSDDHHNELENERERRRRDLKEQSEDHKQTVETIRADYNVLVDKIKELKSLEFEATVESRDSAKAIDALLNQVSTNMNDVAGLRNGLEDRLSKHVDVREALIKKKDEQLQALNSQLIARGQENQEELRLLRETIDRLQAQLGETEIELRSRETTLRRDRDQLEAERRKLDTEGEITVAKLQEEKMRLQNQRDSLKEERRLLHRAVEREHNLITAEKARVAISKRLDPTAIASKANQGENDLRRQFEVDTSYGGVNKVLKQPEIEAMIGVIEAERKKVGKQWEVINAANGKLKAKKESLREDKKLIEDAMHKFAKAERSLDKRLTEADSLAEAASNVREDCQRMTEECKAIETARSKVISEAKAEAVQRLEAVERESQRLEAIREAANKERRRLLHTRTAVLCTRCQRPLVEAGDTKELSNLGLRTAGDGETISSSLKLASLRKEAQRDQDFLAREAQYLQSLAAMV